ncbi:DUF3369 domain-containing protein [Vibrio sonorensis]|uniref:DUF3369 domain-containing protein n=1 Tax=Vibrio sonorensis TaxID=1004316 RepID=UPI0008DAF397|nr:DUF3369 domain-containing protein [Vibrio sonorensis]
MSLFADRRSPKQSDQVDTVRVFTADPWKVLLVDDDQQMHQITKLALNGFEFQSRPLELISALSAKEAKEHLKTNSDIALALIDVVMETEHAGLELVHYIRKELNNSLIRLVLRTGQAGSAPEDTVIRDYEIDDYKEKTELTTQKIKTLLYSMLRSYRDLMLIEVQKQGLSQVIQASANVQNTSSLQTYASSVLSQMTSLLKLKSSAFYCLVQPNPQGEQCRALTLAATGGYVNFANQCDMDLFPEQVAQRCKQVLQRKKSEQFGDAYVLFFGDDNGVDNLLYVNLDQELSELDQSLLHIYMQNIGLTFENINLLDDLRETSKELVYNLANAVEARSKETGAHVQRVSLICERLGELYGLSEQETQLLKHASPLHDVGKVAIPDAILHKPGKLTEEEWKIMQRHVEFGVEILSQSKRKLINFAKEIAAYHHEKWDGTGYPNQLKGEDIPVCGRIAALADVFDALGSKRSYKEPWAEDDIMQEILAQKGRHFDPVLVDLMVDNWNEFVEIRSRYPD